MTANMYIISIEKNVLVGKLSGNEREHSPLQKYSKECKHSLIINACDYIYSFFPLFELSIYPSKIFKYIIGHDEPWPVQLGCLMKR